jgi:hypothetical protein
MGFEGEQMGVASRDINGAREQLMRDDELELLYCRPYCLNSNALRSLAEK